MNAPTADWANFFVAEVGASAALTGLVVVAISINLSKILSVVQLPGRAAEALVVLVGALALTSVALIPNQRIVLFGAETLAIGIVTFVVPLTFQLPSWSAHIKGMSSSKKALRLIISAAGSLLFIAAGSLLFVGSEAGVYWAAAGVIVSLVAGVWNAWVLLIEILR
jgi:hypothetical protein